MPGKVNPVIPEVVNQVSFLVIGLDLTVTLAASAGQLQLNVMEPVITFALFTSIATMEHAVDSLRVNCIDGITANAERTRDMVLNSLGIVTVLKPSLGYKQCAEIAREGYETGKSLHHIVVKERKLLTQEKWDEVFSFDNLITRNSSSDAALLWCRRLDRDRHRLGVSRLDLITLRDLLEFLGIGSLSSTRLFRPLECDRLFVLVDSDDIGDYRDLPSAGAGGLLAGLALRWPPFRCVARPSPPPFLTPASAPPHTRPRPGRRPSSSRSSPHRVRP